MKWLITLLHNHTGEELLLHLESEVAKHEKKYGKKIHTYDDRRKEQ